MKYLHCYETEAQMSSGYRAEYREPWVGAAKETGVKPTFNDRLKYEDYAQMPLTMKSFGGSSTIKWVCPYPIQYSMDSGETWSSLTSATTITLNDQQTVCFKGDRSEYSYTDIDEDDDEYTAYASFAVRGSSVDLMGNIMSMVSGDNYVNATTVAPHAFCEMFCGTGQKIYSARNLILPATELGSYCYSGMFETSHISCPPAVLPATTLSEGCYSNMFSYTSIKEAPVICATTLANSCCKYMFNSCMSLETGPELMAKNLVAYCYSSMFNNCYKLNYIKAMFTDSTIPNYALSMWVQMVYSKNGTFVKNQASSFSTRGSSGIPNGWEIVNETYPS